MRYVVTVIILLCPIYAEAAVLINEVAWMGSADNPNDEWIELRNESTQSVDVTDWVLSDGQNLDIVLDGTIPAGGYAVLERTDDSSAPGSAFLIYTGALSNEGRTLTLLRSNGTMEDRAAGGEGWENIGGDNETKETAQYTNSGWTTGTPTPGRANVSYAPPSAEPKEDDDDDGSAKSSSRTVARSDSEEQLELVLPDVTLRLDLTAPTLAYVHEPLTFAVEPSGIGDTLLASLDMTWNFGDLTTKSGRSVSHAYEYPGTYVVMVHAEYARQHATARHEITVVPVNFSLTTNKDGDLQIHNDAKYEVDLSGYSLRGEETIVFPDNTILLPQSTLTIPKEKLGEHDYAWLMDQEHAVVASTMPRSRTLAMEEDTNNEEVAVTAAEERQPPPAPPRTPAEPVSTPPSEQNNFVFSEAEAAEPMPEENENKNTENAGAPEREAPAQTQTQTQTAALADAKLPVSSDKLPYLGLIGILSLGVLALYATKSQK